MRLRASQQLCRLGFVMAVLSGVGWKSTSHAATNLPYAYELPIEGADCGAFSVANGSMYLFEFRNRQLYRVLSNNKLRPVEDVKGMYVVDVAVVGTQPIYCSRNRIFWKVGGKVHVHPIANSEKLIAVTADAESVYVMEAYPKRTVIVLDRRTARETRRFTYDGHVPGDVVFEDGHLWVLDLGDLCVHRVDRRTGKTTLRFQAGPGLRRGCRGIVFRDGLLYVHEVDNSRLRRIDWEQQGPAVYSWAYDLRLTFVQESWNEHPKNTSNVVFNVPIPPDRHTQAVGDLVWSQKSSRVFKDQFGQRIARFEGIRIPPGGAHTLKYSTNVHAKAVQFDPPPAPLNSLRTIPKTIRKSYLGSNRLYCMEKPHVRLAARQARKSKDGKEPTDVRALVENIASFVARRMSYKMDDSWNDAATVLERNTGSCSEYSFTFSALCRLNDIPTRLIGSIQLGDYGKRHDTAAFHRWTEVWYPDIGWVPVDVTGIDRNREPFDYEFLFGSPGYYIVLSEGDLDPDGLDGCYYILRSYRGGKRKRKTFVQVEPTLGSEKYPVVALRR